MHFFPKFSEVAHHVNRVDIEVEPGIFNRWDVDFFSLILSNSLLYSGHKISYILLFILVIHSGCSWEYLERSARK